MGRWAEFVLRHKLVVVIAWLAVAVAGGVTASATVSALDYRFDLPGKAAYETNQQVVSRFGVGGANDPLLLVARGTPVAEGEFAQAVRAVAAAAPGTRVVLPTDPGAGALRAGDGSVVVAVLYPRVVPGPEPYAAALPALTAAAAKTTVQGQPMRLTGASLLQEGSSGEDRGTLVEILFGALGATVVLALVFGSLLALVPLLVAGVSILATFLCLLGLTSVTSVSFVVQFLVGLIGLGVAIDYSLLVVMRWREERAAGRDDEDAVVAAVRTAGRSVVFSGVTVAVSLAALVAVPLPFLRSIGLGGLLIPLLSVATSVTLLPVLLAKAGQRLSWPRRRPVDPSSHVWAAIARWVTRHRWATIVASLAVLAALAAPVFGLALGTPQVAGLRTGTPEGQAAQSVLDAHLPAGVFRPVELVDDGTEPVPARQLAAIPGVAGVADPGWTEHGRTLRLAWTAADPSTVDGRATLDRIRAARPDAGGSPAEDADFVDAVYGDAPWVVLGVVVVTFLLLAKALRSVWLPVKALVLNVVSLGAAYGVTVLVWQHGYGSQLLFGQDPTGAITTWVPIAAFAFLFGLSMDYEVFILARMRESYDEHGDTRRAVVDGIANTGRLVTSAALILFLAFVALATVPTVEVKILATTLALGIAIDALIVRGLLAPALVAVLGRANWTMPRVLAALLRTRRPR